MNKNLEKWITLKKCDSKNLSISFIDLPDFEKIKLDKISLQTYTNVEELIDTDTDKIKEKFLNEIYNLSKKHDNELLEKFTFSVEMFKDETHETICRKLMSKINNASLYIATNGRIGEATNMIVSKKNYDKYNISDFNGKFEILFENVDDIYLYRKNTDEQPGLILFYYTDENNIDYYKVESIGFYPERQFMKIIIN
jgi:hypothetical protein